MAITDSQMLNLQTKFVSEDLLRNNGLNDPYYLTPFTYIRDELHLHLTCNGMEFKNAVEVANDEDICPEGSDIKVIVDGILAMVFADYLNAVGISLVTYFTYRFHPPSREFQAKLDEFEDLVNLHKLEVKQ